MTDDIKLPGKVTLKGLKHEGPGLKARAFFEHIDECGGWPMAYPYVGFAHTDEREAAFTMSNVNHGYWTTLYHRDDYLLWKLSPRGWGRVFYAMRQDLCSRLMRQAPLPKGPLVQGAFETPVPLSSDFGEDHE